MADSKVGILIEAKDNASSTIKGVKSELSGLGKSTGEVEGLSGAFASLSSAAGVAAGAFAAIEVGKQVVELAQYSAQVQRTETAFATFSQQAGLAANTLDMLRSASRGTISDFDLMQSSNRALALGVADSSQELTQLLEVAIARGKALGVSANQAFSDLVTGIGRMSPLILDNLGIITGGEKLFDAYAVSIGKATSALTDQERKQALVNKVISESKELVAANATAGDDAASSFERAAAAFQNIKADLGSLFGPAIAKFADQIATAVNGVSDALTTDSSEKLQEVQGQVSKLAELMNAYNAAITRMQDTSIAGDGAGMKKAAAEAQGLMLSMEGLALAYNKVAAEASKPQIDINQLHTGTIAYTDASMAAQQLAASGNAVVANSVNQQSALANLGGSLAVLSGEYQRVIALQNAFAGQQAGLASIAGQVIGAAGQEEGLKFLRQQQVALSEQQQAWQDAGYSVAEVNALSIAYNDSLRKTTETTYGYGAAAVKVNRAAAAAVKAVNAEYEDLKNKVSGVLSGALSDVGGVDVNSILPRQDSVSEDARRLADVAVNGFASPWADYLSNKFPDTIGAAFSSGGDIKQTAAQLLKDFQDGLRPELLDKEKAKDLVRRAIVGEKNLKSLTDEIAKELAGELGVSVEQAQAAAAQALGGGGATGGASGATAPKQVPIVPTIDTSKLPTTPISVKATISGFDISGNATYPDVKITVAHIESFDVAEGATKPNVSLPIGHLLEIGLFANVKYPNVSLPIGHLLEVGLAESVKYPNVVVPIGYLQELGLFANVTYPNVSLPIGHLLEIGLFANVKYPNVSLPIGHLLEVGLAESVKYPNVVVPIGYLQELGLFANVTYPNVSLPIGHLLEIGLFANVKYPNVSLPIGHLLEVGLAESVKYPNVVVPIGYLQELGLFANVTYPNVSLPIGHLLEIGLFANVKYPNVSLPIGHLLEVGLAESVKYPNVVVPIGYLQELGLFANVTYPNVVIPIGYVEQLQPLASAVFPVVKLSAEVSNVAPIYSPELELPLQLSAEISRILPLYAPELEKPLALSARVTPQITVTGIDTSTALTYLESELAPIVTPYINYLGIPPEDLQAGGLVIGDGLKLGIVASNIGGAIVTEINKAQELIRSSGKTSGTNWGAGFLETVGQNVPSALVNLLVTLVTPGVLESIGNAGTRTGAQN